ncbi:MAG: hypothetical protein V1778_01685 [bacterium]
MKKRSGRGAFGRSRSNRPKRRRWPTWSIYGRKGLLLPVVLAALGALDRPAMAVGAGVAGLLLYGTLNFVRAQRRSVETE